MKKFCCYFVILAIGCSFLRAQIVVVPDTNYIQIVNSFVLSGVTVSNVQYTGDYNTIGLFSGGGMTNLGLNDGIAMTTGSFDTNVNFPVGSPFSNFSNYNNSGAGDPLLSTLVGMNTYNASVLEFDLVPVGNVLEFEYVFASEEYPEFVGSIFNDVFGFFITGSDPNGGNYTNQNIAIIPGTSLPVAINNVNMNLNSQFYIDNQGLSGQTIVFDGFTTVLTAQIYVIPSATYHLKMAIADVADGVYDSGVFLKAQSMKSYFVITGLNENQENAVSFYPNPADDDNIIFSGSDSKFPVIVTVFDISGKEVHSEILYSDNTSMNISGLFPGIYFVRSSDFAGKINTVKLIRK